MAGARQTHRLLFLSLALALGGAARLPAATASDPPPLCVLDLLAGKLVPGGYVLLSSWAADPVSGAPVWKMEAWLDGATRGDVSLSGHRPDVASHYGRPDYLWSGWTATVSLEGVAPGAHAVEVIAFSTSGARVSCGRQIFSVRPSPVVPSVSPWRIGVMLWLRTAFFVCWLALVGWGPLSLFVRSSVTLLAPASGLALTAVAMETGGVLGARPLASAIALTAASAVTLGISVCLGRVRLQKPAPTTVVVLALGALFAVAVTPPLATHGKGAVLGVITDAAWECSVADSIARFGWTIPPDVRGASATIPFEWRRFHFRAGAPYPLALLCQAYRLRAHEAHSVLILALGVLILCATGALAARLLRLSRPARWLAVALVASSSVLDSELYNQHAGILLATTLYVPFLFFLLSLVSSRRALVPLAWTLAAEWTLYPETMILWVGASGLALLLVSRRQQLVRTTARLFLAALLAALINPVALVRSVRFTRALPRASVLATPDSRVFFGDTHYFPSVRVIAGIEPYRVDAPAPAADAMRAVQAGATILLLVTVAIGFRFLYGRERRALALLLLPVIAWLVANRYLDFPYGFSKALPHAVPVWSVSLLLLARGASRTGRSGSRSHLGTVLFVANLVLVGGLSLLGAREAISRARRAVPGYDPAFLSLPELARDLPRDYVIEVSDPVGYQRDWIAYFLGDNLVASPGVVQETVRGSPVLRLIDRRDPDAPRISAPIRSNAIFALVPL